jgi:hypothetical protein
MVALSQDLTPRNIYGPGPRGARGSADSYGFPSTHSSASSISSGGNYPYYSASVGSVDSSVTDYSSTTSESYESRTLPRPTSLLAGSAPPGPQSMMSQFSSKMPSNTQKKHKCKVCDKRFTRPSSLQTHMYSHTGEKRKSSLHHAPSEIRSNSSQHSRVMLKAAGGTSPLSRTCAGTRKSTRARRTPAPATTTSNFCQYLIRNYIILELFECALPAPGSRPHPWLAMIQLRWHGACASRLLVQHGYPFHLYLLLHFIIGVKIPHTRMG